MWITHTSPCSLLRSQMISLFAHCSLELDKAEDLESQLFSLHQKSNPILLEWWKLPRSDDPGKQTQVNWAPVDLNVTTWIWGESDQYLINLFKEHVRIIFLYLKKVNFLTQKISRLILQASSRELGQSHGTSFRVYSALILLCHITSELGQRKLDLGSGYSIKLFIFKWHGESTELSSNSSSTAE